ncbi:MAG: hypothetical protein G01um101444_83 [Parcubacteria group bacterium Gr01-1014_44]|nr:MAG: hypothetical protein G01um101444_83 [Parcubacteria group bacterium Gr01-1014_44]
MSIILLYLRRRIFFIIYILFFVLSFFSSPAGPAGAYSLDDPAGPLDKATKSIFNQNPLQFSPIDVTKFIKSDPKGLSFSDLTNTEGFSSNDIGSSAKAVLALFIRLIITTLNTTLGIFKVLLDILTSRF